VRLIASSRTLTSHDLKDMPEIERLVHLKDLEELLEQLMH
jgi:hypothetical protein